MIGTGLDHAVQRSPNFGERAAGTSIDMLLLHYTAMKSGPAAVNWLCAPQSGVSCHYLVDVDGAITQMVCEGKRAWHAGASYWRGVSDINSHSVGIEIQNEGHAVDPLPAFPAAQIEAVIALGLDITARHNIPAARVLGHSDVAPGRKVDPGPKFAWAQLAARGLGVWPQTVTVGEGDVTRIQADLKAIGFDCPQSGKLDDATRKMVSAFQLHYRPRSADGEIDGETCALAHEVVRLSCSSS